MRKKLVIYGLVLFLFAIFIVQNAETVSVTFFFWDLTMPRALLLLLTFLLGAVFWALLPIRKLFPSKKSQ